MSCAAVMLLATRVYCAAVMLVIRVCRAVLVLLVCCVVAVLETQVLVKRRCDDAVIMLPETQVW